MLLDLVVIGLLAMFGFFGWRTGALGQALRVGAAIAVFLFAAPTSLLVRQQLWPDKAMSGPAVEIGSMVLAALLLYIGVSVLGWLVIRSLRKASDTLSFLDTLLGTGLGLIKGGLLVYFLVSCVALGEGVLERFDPSDNFHLRDGGTLGIVRQHNLLAPWRFPDVERLGSALRVAEHVREHGTRQLAAYEQARAILQSEAFRQLAAKAPEEVTDGAKQGGEKGAKGDTVHTAARYAQLLADPTVRAFLADPKNAEALKKVDWAAVERALGVAEKRAEKKSAAKK